MKIGISTRDVLKTSSDVLMFVTEEDVKKLNSRIVPGKFLLEAINANNFKGKKHTSIVVPVTTESFSKVVLVGLGKRKDVTLEIIRRSAHVGLRVFSSLKTKSFATMAPRLKIKHAKMVRAISDGLRLSNYEFDKYMTKEESKFFRIGTVMIHVPTETTELKQVLEFSSVSCNATNFARELQTDDADIVNPEYLVKVAKSVAKIGGMRIRVLNKAALKRAGLNLMLGVGQGSRFNSSLIIIEYKGDPKSKELVALVGKGITYDTGGLDIKTRGMGEMNMDMSGSAIVLATIGAISKLGFKKNVIAVAPVVENAVGVNSYKPGSVIKSYSGKTVEIGNTDAEGRLILADAMSYVIDKYKPTRVLDVATLTGSIMVALGYDYAGLFSTDSEVTELLRASEVTGELVWRMPLPDDYLEFMKSKKADLNNISTYPNHFAGSITASMFLKEFVGDVPWTHLDIAGTGMGKKRNFYWPQFGTGYGVRLLLEWLR